MKKIDLAMAKFVELTHGAAVLCVDVLADDASYTAGVEVEGDAEGNHYIHVQHVSWCGDVEGSSAGAVWEYLESDANARSRLLEVVNDYRSVAWPAWRAA